MLKSKTSSLLKFGILFSAVSLLAANSGKAQAFATNDFALVTAASGTTDPTAPPSVVGLGFNAFTAVGYAGNSSGAGRFSFATNSLGGLNATDDFSLFTGSIDLSKYYEITLTPQAGYSLNLDTISFTVQRSGTGIRSYAVRSSVDSFGANLAASISPANANLGVGGVNEFRVLLDTVTTAQAGSLVTLGASFDLLTAPVTFRFYGWNAEGVGGTFSIDNVVYSGAVTSVPEPGPLALVAGFGLLGLVMSSRSRR